MNLLFGVMSLVAVTTLLTGCEQVTEVPEQNTAEMPEQNTTEVKERLENKSTDYEIISWTDLMPAEDLAALSNPPSYITDTEEGSLEDQVSNGLERAMASEVDDPYQRALVSINVIEGFDNKAIKLPGFVVPLEFDDEGVIIEFFLVPFFGACIHVPAPPPNQMIYVKYAQGLELEELYSPVWVSGILTTSLVENDMATSAYSLNMASFELYNETPL